MANKARLTHLGVSTDYAELYSGSTFSPGALEAAVTGDTVTVLEDCTFSSTATLGQNSCIYIYDKGITLDLNGNTLTFTPTQDTTKATAIEIKNTGSGTLETVIENGTIKTENGCTGIYVDAGSTVTMNSLLVDQNGTGAQAFNRYAAIMLADSTDAKAVINSGSYTAENIVIDANTNTNLQINSGSFYCKNNNIMSATTADGTDTQGYKSVFAATGCTAEINGGIFGKGDAYDITLSTLNGGTITGGTFNGQTLSANANTSITGGTFNNTIKYTSAGAGLNTYDITGGTFSEDVTEFVTDSRYIVMRSGAKYKVVMNPVQDGDDYKYMNGTDLFVLWNLIKNTFDFGADKAIELDSEKNFSVRFNEDKAITVDTANKLAVKIDDITVKFDSEGRLKAQGVLAGKAIEFIESEGLQVINVKYDGKTIVLNSENQIEIPIDDVTIKLNSEGELYATGVEAGKAIELVDSENDGIKTINVLFDSESIVLNSEGKLKANIDDHTIVIGSEGKIAVPIDNITIKVNSEGKLQAAGVKEGIAIELTDSENTGVNTINVRKDDKTVVVDSEGNLSVPIDNKTITINSEGKINVPIDSETIIINSEGKLAATFVDPTAELPIEVDEDNKISLRYDGATITLDSEDRLQINIDNKTIVLKDGLVAVPIDEDTIIIDSEDRFVSPRAYINGVELKDDKNTEEIKVTQWVTEEEYAELEAAGQINPYTLYVVNTSEGYIESTPNYNELDNKPQINHVELTGDKSVTDLGLQAVLTGGTAIDLSSDIVNLKYHAGVLSVNTSNELVADTYTTDKIDNMLGSLRTIKVVTVEPSTEDAAKNTLYYVATGTPNLYNVVLFDSDKTRIALGTSQVGIYTAGKAIDIDVNNVISVVTDSSVTSAATQNYPPSTKAVYDFLMTGASTTTAGERGLVPAPAANQMNYCLTGAGTWTPIVDDVTTGGSTSILSAEQGKQLQDEIDEINDDRLGTDIDWTELATSNTDSGTVRYRKRNNIVEFNIDGIRLNMVSNLQIATGIPVAIRPKYRSATTLTALNNNNAPCGFSVNADGSVWLYQSTGRYESWGTLTYISEA